MFGVSSCMTRGRTLRDTTDTPASAVTDGAFTEDFLGLVDDNMCDGLFSTSPAAGISPRDDLSCVA